LKKHPHAGAIEILAYQTTDKMDDFAAAGSAWSHG